MSDRAKGLIVALDREIRADDDLEPILIAIRMIKGVAAVTVSVANPDDWMARRRVESQVRDRLYEAIATILSESK